MFAHTGSRGHENPETYPSHWSRLCAEAVVAALSATCARTLAARDIFGQPCFAWLAGPSEAGRCRWPQQITKGW